MVALTFDWLVWLLVSFQSLELSARSYISPNGGIAASIASTYSWFQRIVVKLRQFAIL
jgi:hypothetical protein